MSRILIFDVDGTLALSGQKVDPLFSEFLMSFWGAENCYLVTGSGREKLQSQLPPKLLNLANGVLPVQGTSSFQAIRRIF